MRRDDPPKKSTTTESFESRLGFETMLSDLSSRFINLPPDEVDTAIENAQQQVCEVLGVDLSALWEGTDATRDPLILTHFYSSREDLLPPMRGMSALEYFPWLQQEMLAGRSVVASSLDDFPEAAAFDRENLRLFGVKSNLTIPLSVGGKPPVGALGFNTTEKERDWPDALVKRLQLVAQVFTHALDRRRHELILQESEARLNLAADSAGVGLWTLDFGTRTFWLTEKARAIFGYSPDELISMERFEASVHPDDRHLIQGAIDRAARLGEPIKVEYRITLPDDGGVRWISSLGRPQFKPTGELERLMGVSTDITQRRHEEAAFRVSEARLAAGADLAGLAFYEVDFGERVIWLDDRFREICGVPPEREEGLQALEFWMEHLHPDDRGRMLDLRQQMHDGRLDQISIEYRYLHPTQGEKWIHHAGRVARRDAAGHTTLSFGVLRDITERKRVEDELRNLSRRLIRAHEEERALLARELHDDVTQRLAVLAIDLGRAELAAPDGAQAETLRAAARGAHAPQRGHPLPCVPAAPVGPGGARPGRGAPNGMRTAESPGAGRCLGWISIRYPTSSGGTRRSACSAWRRRR